MIVWSPSKGVHGEGWATCILGGMSALLVPHISTEGLSRRDGYALMLDRRRLALIPDLDPDRARDEASRILDAHEAYVMSGRFGQ